MGISLNGGISLSGGDIKYESNIEPVWITSSGDLGTLTSGANLTDLNITLSATDADDGPNAITYTIVRGSLPTGGTLDTNTGAITGPVVLDGANEPVVFTVRASDGRGFVDREFSITVNEFVAPEGDEHWDNVVMLMTADGGTFTDKKNSHVGVTGSFATNAPVISTTQAKFGTHSLHIDEGYLEFDDSEDWHFDFGDFTVEFWIYIDTFNNQSPNNTYGDLMGQWSSGIGNESWLISSSKQGSTGFSYTTNGQTDLAPGIGQGDGTLIPGQWHHVAISRIGPSIGMFVDGVGTVVSNMGTVSIFNSSRTLTLGGRDDNAKFFTKAFYDQVRITKGVGRYSGNFVPPTVAFPTQSIQTPDPHIANTVLVMNFEDDLVDGTGRHTPVTEGSAPFVNGYFGRGISLNGFNQKVTVPKSDDFEFGSGDFTIEGFFYFNTVSTDVFFTTLDAPYNGFYVATIGSGLATLFKTDTMSPDNRNNHTLVANTWYHVAFVRHGDIYTVYVNGTSVQTGAITGSMLPTTANFEIGGDVFSSNNYFNGIVDSVRVTKGVARYTTTFTPPDEPFSTI